MKRISRWPFAAFAGLTLLFGCAAGPGGPADQGPSECRLIGELFALGQGKVYLNGQRIDRRTRVCHGDRITTGGDSGAWLAFAGGGHIHFDERTDPIFRLIRELVIEVLDINRGQVHAESPPGGQVVMRYRDGTFETEGTRFNLKVEPDRSVLTVLEGRMHLLQPQAGLVKAREQVGLGRGELLYRRALSSDELQEVIRWHERFPQPGSERPPDERPSTGAEAWRVPDGITELLVRIFFKEHGGDRDKPPGDGGDQDNPVDPSNYVDQDRLKR
jgi:hypothetical protein